MPPEANASGGGVIHFDCCRSWLGYSLGAFCDRNLSLGTLEASVFITNSQSYIASLLFYAASKKWIHIIPHADNVDLAS